MRLQKRRQHARTHVNQQEPGDGGAQPREPLLIVFTGLACAAVFCPLLTECSRLPVGHQNHCYAVHLAIFSLVGPDHQSRNQAQVEEVVFLFLFNSE